MRPLFISIILLLCFQASALTFCEAFEKIYKNRLDGFAQLKGSSYTTENGLPGFNSKVPVPGFDTAYIMWDQGATKAHFFARTINLPDRITDQRINQLFTFLHSCYPVYQFFERVEKTFSIQAGQTNISIANLQNSNIITADNRAASIYFITTGTDRTKAIAWIGKSLRAGPDSSYIYLGMNPMDYVVPQEAVLYTPR